jgi:uncharacterized protein (TIGR02300 family)
LIKGGAAKALRGTNVAKAELGTKRLCPNCGAKYYDLNHHPIVCPRCNTQFEPMSSAKVRAQAKAAAVQEDEDEVEEVSPAEFVSLEEADEETADSGKVDSDTDVDDDVVADDDDEADDTFLEEEEEEGDDVADIIGDVDEEER